MTLEAGDWRILSVFENEVRIGILRLLLEFEFRSLSEIAEDLAGQGWKMTLSGVIKHMKELETAGLVRHQSGVFADKPDARKRIYFLQGRERVETVLKDLKTDVLQPLRAGIAFYETAKLARAIQRIGHEPAEDDRKCLESLLAKCESKAIYVYLTEDERKKLRLWRMMMSII